MVEKKITQIWIGELDPPEDWMMTWREMNPNWDYVLLDNEFLVSRPWRCALQMLHYLKKGLYAGVADLMRYEYLYEHGGVLMASDSICLRPLDELFDNEPRLQASTLLACVHAAPRIEDRKVSPYFLASPRNPILGQYIDALARVSPDDLRAAFMSTGNWCLREFHGAYGYEGSGEVVVLSRQTFNPTQPHIFRKALRGELDGQTYDDVLAEDILRVMREGEAYAYQYWGSTLGQYEQFNAHLSKDERKKRRLGLVERFQKSQNLCEI